MLRLFTIFFFLPCLSLIALGPNGLPNPPKEAEKYYAAIWNISPFTKKSVSTGIIQPTNPLATDYCLVGMGTSPDGLYFITLANKKNHRLFSIDKEGNNQENIKLEEIKEGKTLAQTRVRVSKAGQEGWIGVDQTYMSQRVTRRSAKTAIKRRSPQKINRRSQTQNRNNINNRNFNPLGKTPRPSSQKNIPRRRVISPNKK